MCSDFQTNLSVNFCRLPLQMENNYCMVAHTLITNLHFYVTKSISTASANRTHSRSLCHTIGAFRYCSICTLNIRVPGGMPRFILNSASAAVKDSFLIVADCIQRECYTIMDKRVWACTHVTTTDCRVSNTIRLMLVIFTLIYTYPISIVYF